MSMACSHAAFSPRIWPLASSPRLRRPPISLPTHSNRLLCRSLYVDDEDYLLDAPVSVGDGFSFAGGKYSDTEGPAEKWIERGKMINAYALKGNKKKAQDPIFGLALGKDSQILDDDFRWFYIEEGDPDKPTVLLVHGFPSQAYSFRKVIPMLSTDYHVIAFDWIGFGFSDKPQVGYGFNYTREDYENAFTCLVDSLGLEKMSIVCQGYSAPIIVNYANKNGGKVDCLVFMNSPVTDEHAKLPSALSIFSNLLLGEIFAQDPIRAGEKPLNECGPYILDEEDAMVYRRPYLTSGSAGFALIAIVRALRKELKVSVEVLRKSLSSSEWAKRATFIWGMKDRWLSFRGVPEFTSSAGVQLLQLQAVGHHAQEDFPEEVGKAIKSSLKLLLG